jgi:hypothetical protein
MLPSFRHFISRQHQHLHEQRLDLDQETPTERGDAVVVGLRVRGNEAKRHRIVTSTLDLAAGVHAGGVAVHQQAQQHRRVIGRTATSSVLPHKFAQVHLFDDLYNEAGQVVLRQPIIH